MEESDNVPSSAFIHGDNDEMVEHGILPSTTVMYDDLSDFCHHIESESDYTICDFECTYFEGVSAPPHRESVIVDRSREAIFTSNNLTSTSTMSSHLVRRYSMTSSFLWTRRWPWWNMMHPHMVPSS